jgi:hypothetical protein
MRSIRACSVFITSLLLTACGDASGPAEDNLQPADSNDGWIELSPEDADVVRNDLNALENQNAASADTRSGAEIAAAIDAYHLGDGATGYFDSPEFLYRASEYGQITSLPPDAAANGITGAAGFMLDASDGPFKTVLVSYLVFDDPNKAADYRELLNRNFTQSMVDHVSFKLSGERHSTIEVRCVYVPDTDHSVNCHHAAANGRIVATALFAEGPELTFTGREPAINLVFSDLPSMQRIMSVAGKTASYVVDASRP